MNGLFDVAVVGGGLTGLTAAHHAALEGCSVVHFTGSGVPGGLVANVGELEGFPTAGPASALDIALRLTEENARLGVEAVPEDVATLEIGADVKRLVAGNVVHQSRAVIAATGARLRALDAPGAARLTDKGVSQCAWCNGSLHRGAEVVVVGGGDSALQEALHLATFASQVTIVTRGPLLKARRSLVDRAAANERVAFRWETDVLEIVGHDSVTGIRIRDQSSGAIEQIGCTGVFVYIGLEPASRWLQGRVDLDPAGHVRTGADLATSASGVFAAGAVRSGYRGRLTHAVGEATAAAMAAARHVSD
ncbi:MAG: NAD(P)/FAD-dependent oxidoreductase [Hyphomicrobiaceae bacterium]|nr:NAD(P)/FAD-dependent oxidoreductase [Hyphomicrobiaceae bacterium]